MGFSIGPIKLPSPSDVVNAVKDTVTGAASTAASTATDVAEAAVDTATDVAGTVAKVTGELDLTKVLTGPLGTSKLGLDMLSKGAGTVGSLASGAAGAVKDGIGEVLGGSADDAVLEAGGRGRVTSTSDTSTGMV